MTAAPAMSLPGGRVLLGWWRELASLSPRRLWVAHFLLHRVEACVEVHSTPPLHPLPSALLPLLTTPRSVDDLARELNLERSLLTWLLQRLHQANVVHPAPDAQHLWCLAPDGQILATQEPPAERARRVFWFIEQKPPLFFPLTNPTTTTLPDPATWWFDPVHLEACIQQPASWKAQHGFPEDVRALLRPQRGAADPSPETVILDRAEQLSLALVELENEIRGFTVHPDTWRLITAPPILRAPPEFRDVLGTLGGESDLEGWRHTWQQWCHQRNLPAAEVDACKLELVNHQLRVAAPPKLLERLRQARSEALRGEAWLASGGDRLKAVVQVVIE